MKKIVSFVLVLAVLACAFCSCGKAKFTLDGKVLAFEYAQKELSVEVCSAENAERYPTAEIAEYTLKASDGVLTIVGAEGAYSGEYSVYETGKNYVVYNVAFGEKSGYAVLSTTEYADGTQEYTLLLTIAGYTSNFTSGIFTE